MRIIIVLSTLFLFSSCDLIFTIAELTETSPPPAISYLKLTDNSYNGLFHNNIYLTGTIENTHYSRTIESIVITATIHLSNGSTTTETITVTAVDSGSKTTFEKKVYVPNNSSVELKVTSASF